MSDRRFIPVSEPSLGEAERDALARCIESGWISSEGPEVERFEQEMASFAGRRHGIAVSSGTAALDIAVAALDIGPGDEVIVPTFTIISCVLQVVRSGATPVFIDADPETWNIDVPSVAERITPRTRAMIIPHIYGLPADMAPLIELAEAHGIHIIEDAAEAHGLEYQGRPCGSFGTLSTFSFYPNKLITTGEGGMIVTDDHALAERCRSLRNLAFAPGRRFVHHELGWNYRMTNLQAALGLAQLQRAPELLRRRRAIGRRYLELLSDVEELQLPLMFSHGSESVFWVFGVVADETVAPAAEAIMNHLLDAGIGTRPFFYPLHQQPILRAHGFGLADELPVAERIAQQGFYIPLSASMPEGDVMRVAEALRAAVERLGS
jgi:perosamine synthetase